MIASILLFGAVAAASPLVSKAGQSAAVPNWALQSSSGLPDLTKISQTGFDVSSWHKTPSSRCTLMGCMLDAGEYKDSELWYSDNLNHFNWGQFSVPWVYRNEFELSKDRKDQHFLLQTNGISSKADLFLNGHQVADSEFQVGAYAGHTYDITKYVKDTNALAVKVYPTQYLYDFGVGFVDWNPYSPDNGTGIWRDINIKQTGPVSMGPLSVLTDIDLPVESSKTAKVTVRAKAQNLEKEKVTLFASARVSTPSGDESPITGQTITLAPGETKMVTFQHTVKQPRVWWPKCWGGQPLYEAEVNFSVNSAISDSAKTSFGIRKVTSEVNSHNDTIFAVNGHPFQVIGGGYGADMFLRWDSKRFSTIAQYMLDMGLNTIRLEGKMEQPELYEIADKIGLMVIAGWECCDKWEAWDYNHDLAIDPPPIWDEADYATANHSMIHEAAVLQTHPSMLGYLVGSDYWPNDRATKMYVDALKAAGWQVPVIASASKRGYPDLLGPSGMKMDGPYDWIPPNYWYDVEPAEERLGAAFGFGSELGAGVGTPELGSLKKFLSKSDLEDLWKKPNKGLFHMSNNVSSFYDREIYNIGLYNRYGKPTSLDDYLVKAQLMDYEATRSQHEGFSALWNAKRPATGTIYWMLNNAWPSLHWNQFDYYLRPAGSYYGTKTGSRLEHVAYDYLKGDVYLINHSLDRSGARSVEIEAIDLNGKVVSSKTIKADTVPNKSKSIGKVGDLKIKDVVFLRLKLLRGNKVVSRNIYWLAKNIDTLQWDNSTWYYTPITKFADFSAISTMKTAQVSATVSDAKCRPHAPDVKPRKVTLQNKSDVPAFFVSLNLIDKNGDDVLPVLWSDNYVTLWPHEKLDITLGEYTPGDRVEIKGFNVKRAEARI